MATVRETISYGLRLARIYAPGETPDADTMTDGLTAFQGMFDQWVANGMFGRLTDVYKTAAYTANEGERVVSTSTVSTPSTITNDGNERAPYDLSLIEAIESGTRKVYLYDRTGWVRIDNLTLDSTAPLSTRGMDGLAAAFALRFVEMFGEGTIGPAMADLGRRFMGSISGKHGTTQPVSAATYY
jgi:hypothetical protein